MKQKTHLDGEADFGDGRNPSVHHAGNRNQRCNNAPHRFAARMTENTDRGIDAGQDDVPLQIGYIGDSSATVSTQIKILITAIELSSRHHRIVLCSSMIHSFHPAYWFAPTFTSHQTQDLNISNKS